MKRKLFAFLMSIILVMSLPITASADIGPKPSVRIQFTGIQGETYYGTLLSERRSTGPSTAWDGYEDYPGWKPENEKVIWENSLVMKIPTVITSCRSGGIALNPIS